MEMLRDFLSKAQPIAGGAADLVVFDKGVPRGPFKRLGIVMTGTADDGSHNGFQGDGWSELVLKLNNHEIWNVTPAQLATIIEAMISPIGGVVPADKAKRFTLPLDGYVETGLLGLPDRGPVTLEMQFEAASTAGEVELSYEFWDKVTPPSAFFEC